MQPITRRVIKSHRWSDYVGLPCTAFKERALRNSPLFSGSNSPRANPPLFKALLGCVKWPLPAKYKLIIHFETVLLLNCLK
jgi:hypothetical protein